MTGRGSRRSRRTRFARAPGCSARASCGSAAVTRDTRRRRWRRDSAARAASACCSTRAATIRISRAGNIRVGWLPNHYFSLSQGFGYGMRPFAGGGIGILCDLKGDDHYVADVYGQGASYWYSVGLLLDAGRQRYLRRLSILPGRRHSSEQRRIDRLGRERHLHRARTFARARRTIMRSACSSTARAMTNTRRHAPPKARRSTTPLRCCSIVPGNDSYTGTDPQTIASRRPRWRQTRVRLHRADARSRRQGQVFAGPDQ